jgi:hypothetical protein
MCHSGELGCGIQVRFLRREASAVTKDGGVREQWVDLGMAFPCSILQARMFHQSFTSYNSVCMHLTQAGWHSWSSTP